MGVYTKLIRADYTQNWHNKDSLVFAEETLQEAIKDLDVISVTAVGFNVSNQANAFIVVYK